MRVAFHPAAAAELFAAVEYYDLVFRRGDEAVEVIAPEGVVATTNTPRNVACR